MKSNKLRQKIKLLTKQNRKLRRSARLAEYNYKVLSEMWFKVPQLQRLAIKESLRQL